MESSLIEPRTRGFVLRVSEDSTHLYWVFQNEMRNNPLTLVVDEYGDFTHKYLKAGVDYFSVYNYDEEVVTQLIQWQNMRVILGLDPKVRVIGGFVDGKCNVERI